MTTGWLLWQRGAPSVFCTLWDRVNTWADGVLVGVTPGLRPATETVAEARCSLVSGPPSEDTIRPEDAVGPFSGRLWSTPTTMLDRIRLAVVLDFESMAQRFDEMHHLGGLISAVDYPAFRHRHPYHAPTRLLSGIRCWPRWWAPA